MSEVAVQAAVSKLLEAAQHDQSQIITFTGEVVNGIKQLCLELPPQAQLTLREKLTNVVLSAKGATKGDVSTKDKSLQELMAACSLLLGALHNVSKPLPPPLSPSTSQTSFQSATPSPSRPMLYLDSPESTSSSLISDHHKNPPLDFAASDSEDEASDDRPRRPSSLALSVGPPMPPLFETLSADLDRLSACAEEWRLSDFVKMTTEIVKQLPLLLHEADDCAALNPEIAQNRQNVIAACGALTSLIKSLAKYPNDPAFKKQVQDAVNSLQAWVGVFIDSIISERGIVVPGGLSPAENDIKETLLAFKARYEEIQLPVFRTPEAKSLSECHHATIIAIKSFGSLLEAASASPEDILRGLHAVALEMYKLLQYVDFLFNTEMPDERAACHALGLGLLNDSLEMLDGMAGAQGDTRHDVISLSLVRIRSHMAPLINAVSALCVLATQKEEKDATSILQSIQQEQGVYGNFAHVMREGIQELSDEEEEELSSSNREALGTYVTVQHVRLALSFRVAADFPPPAPQQGEIIAIENVIPDMTVRTFKSVVERQTHIPSRSQFLFREASAGPPTLLPEDSTLRALGLVNHEMLILRDSEAPPIVAPRTSTTPKFALNATDIKMDESKRLWIMQQIKEGKLSVEEAVLQVKSSPSPSPTPPSPGASRRGTKNNNSHNNGNDPPRIMAPGKYVNVLSNKDRKKEQDGAPSYESTSKPVESRVDVADMTVASFSILQKKPRVKIIKEGKLTKEGANRKSMKVRWFVLTSESLYYYKTSSEKSALGEISLSTCQGCKVASERKEPHCFALLPAAPTGRTFYIVCTSDAEMKEWMDLINACIPNKRSRHAKLSIVQDCIGQLMHLGVQIEGIFRIPGNHAQIKKLAAVFEGGGTLNLKEVLNQHTLTGLIKKIFKDELVEPLVAKDTQRAIEAFYIHHGDDEAMVTYLKDELLRNVQSEELVVLRALVRLFIEVCENEQVTSLSYEQAGRSFGASLFTAMSEERSRTIFSFILMHAQAISLV